MAKSSLDYAELAGLRITLGTIKLDTTCDVEKVVREWLLERIKLLSEK